MTLSRRLLVLIVLALLPPLAIQAWTAFEQHRDGRETLRDDAMAQARAVQADMSRLAGSVRQLLVAMSEVPAIREGDPTGCTAYLREVARQFRGFALLAVTDAGGRVLCNSVGSPPGTYSNANRGYFIRARDSGGFAAGDLVTGITSGQQTLHFALPLRSGSGEFAGVVLAGVEQSWLSHEIANEALSPGAQAFLIDPAGVIAAGVDDGRPMLDGWVGRAADPALRRALGTAVPASFEAAGPDGSARLYGAVPPDPALGGMLVAVALDQGRTFSGLNRTGLRNALGLALGASLALTGALIGRRRLVLAPLATLSATAERVGQGEAAAREALGRQAGGLKEVGVAFGRMSEALASSQQERNQAQAAERAGAARLAWLLEMTPAGIVELDRDGRFVYANPAAERILGAAPGELARLRYDSPEWHYAGRDGAPIAAGQLPAQRALEGVPVLDAEHRLTRLDGRRTVLLVDAVPVLGEDATPMGALAAFQDVGARHEQAAALRESEAQLRSFVENASEVLWIRNARARRLVYLSPSYESIWGETRDRVLQDLAHWDTTIHPDDRAAALHAIRQALDGLVSTLEYRIVRPDGSIRWIQNTAFPIRDADGAVVRVGGIARDVTDSKAAATALHETAWRLQNALAAASLGDYDWEIETGLVRTSERARAIFGFAPDEGTGLAEYFQRIVPDDLARVQADVAAGLLAGRIVTRYRIRRPDGVRAHVLSMGEVVRDEAGEPVRVIGLFTDETERQVAEQRQAVLAGQLAAERARMAVLIENLPVGVNFMDARGKTLLSNPAFRRYLPDGVMPSQSPEREAQWIGHDAQGNRLRRDQFAGACALRGETVLDQEFLYRPPGGPESWARVFALPLRDPAGAVSGALVVIVDIDAAKRAQTELARLNATLEHQVETRTAELMAAEAALRQAQKMEAVGQLTGGIAHDFNNMLQAIGGALEMVRRRVEQGRPEEAARYAEGARGTVDRAAALTHRLLAFARRQTLQPKPVRLATLIEGMGELIERTVGPAVTVQIHLHDSTVLCDPNQLENVLLNLAINARDAMQTGGRLTIRTRDVTVESGAAADVSPGAYVELSVSDTGIGMDADTQARAFEPFFTTKPIGQGTGLGLSQTYGFARQSDGAVHLDSAPGQGTTVRLLLPRREAEIPAVTVAPVREEGAGLNRTVMLVEDEPEVRAIAAERLRELGYVVVEAEDGPSALRAMRLVAHVDILVTDVGLPGGLNGRQVADAAREQRPGLPVVFITGFAGAVLEDQLAPGMAIVTKPFTLETLAAQITAMLAVRAGAPAQA